MTEQELDRIMRRVLIDSLKTETEQSMEEQAPLFEESSKHRRQMHAMLANPLRWLHRREHTVWRRVLQRVAVISLACILTFSSIMALSPTARASVVRWVMEWYGNTINYLYTGEQNSELLPQYEISDLPCGFVETTRDIAPALVAVTYENHSGDIIFFDYSFMHQGSQTNFILNDDDVFDVQVNGMYGKFFRSHTSEKLSDVTWIDSEQNIQFTIGGCLEYDVILHMAETVSLCKTTK